MGRILRSEFSVGCRSLKRLAGAFVVALALFALSAGAASGQAVQCGQVITEDVRLDSNLGCPVGSNGLVIGADRVVVDLNGHTLSGFVSPSPTGPGTAGIDNGGGYDWVGFRHGTIRGFNSGMVLTGASHNRLRALNVEGNGAPAIGIAGGVGNIVRRSELTSGFVTLSVTGSDRVRIVGNTANSLFNSVAMSIFSSFGVIARNTTGTTATGAISVSGSSNRIVHNEVLRGRTNPRGPLAGIDIASGSRNLVARSRASAGGDGILVFSSATDTIVRRNLAEGNADDGIEVQSPSARLIRNIANDNGDYGIEAVPGVLARGNRATGNGNLLAQCLNVLCSP